MILLPLELASSPFKSTARRTKAGGGFCQERVFLAHGSENTAKVANSTNENEDTRFA